MRFDFHVHSNISGDCHEPMESVVQSAIEKGLSGLCFTDHCDLIDSEHPGQVSQNCYTDWQKSYEQINFVRERYGKQIEIFHGMELGEMAQDPGRARQFSETPGLDFLLGSVHALEGYQDFYFLDYPDFSFCENLAELYLDENIRTAQLDLMDVLAHLGYFNRYMSKIGVWIDLMNYEEKLRHLFAILIQNGRGIELNTSGLRRNPGPNHAIPDLPVLTLYKECGGEIITIGSDAHTAKHVGAHLAEAESLLQAAGFRYKTICRQRKPIFIKL